MVCIWNRSSVLFHFLVTRNLIDINRSWWTRGVMALLLGLRGTFRWLSSHPCINPIIPGSLFKNNRITPV